MLCSYGIFLYKVDILPVKRSSNGRLRRKIIRVAASFASLLLDGSLKLTALLSFWYAPIQDCSIMMAHFFICFILCSISRSNMIDRSGDTLNYGSCFLVKAASLNFITLQSFRCTTELNYSQFLVHFSKGVMCEGNYLNKEMRFLP